MIFADPHRWCPSADLALLDRLPRAKGARWDYIERSACLPGTRVEELNTISGWIHSETERPLYLLTGLAGTGKTTIAQSVAELAHQDGVLGASFFCSRDSDERNTIEFIFPTIAFLLSEFSPRFRAELVLAVKKKLDIGHALPDEQLQKLIIEPLRRIGSLVRPVVIVVDALDECRDDKTPEKILLALSRHIQSIPLLKIFITSRPVFSSRFALRDPSLHQLSNILILHEVDRTRVDDDIRLFITVRLADIMKRRSSQNLPSPWPTPGLVDELVEKASGLFIFASTICKFIESPGDPYEHLKEITKIHTTMEGRLGIDKLYQKVIDTALASFADEKLISCCRFVVGTIVLFFNPLPLKDLAKLLDLTPVLIREVLRDLHSALVIPAKDDGVIRIFHASFHDFLTDQARCMHSRIYVQPARQHAEITKCLFKQMMQGLKRNLCEVDGFKLHGEIEDLAMRREKYIGNSLAYACRYWAEHLSHVLPEEAGVDELVQALDKFVRTKLLYWIEVLSLLGESGDAVTHLNRARRWHSVSARIVFYSCSTDLFSRVLQQVSRPLPNLDEIFSDTNRLLLEFSEPILAGAYHIYNSALPFTSHESALYKTFQHEVEVSVRVLSGGQMSSDSCLRVMEGHSGPVEYVAFSPDGTRIVSKSEDGTARLYDSNTSAHITTFKRHPYSPHMSVVFSPNSARVVSFSSSMLLLWDTMTGNRIATLAGHTDAIYSVALSPDSTQIVSGSDDRTVRLWSSTNGTCIATLLGHSEAVRSVAFSPDSALIVSGSEDRVIRLWSALTGACITTLTGHGGPVKAVVFSPCSMYIASVSLDCTARIWNLINGACSAKPKVRLDGGNPVTFSPDGARFVHGDVDGKIQISELSTGTHVANLKGHSTAVNLVTFSPDGTRIVAVSSLGRARLWNVITTKCILTFGVPASQYGSISFSPDSSRLSSANDHQVKVWDTSNGACIATLKGHTNAVNSISFSPDSACIVSGSDDCKVRLWYPTPISQGSKMTNPSSWGLAITRFTKVKGQASETNFVTLSPNGKRLVCGSRDGIVLLWDSTAGTCISKLKGRFGPLYSVAFSFDSALLVSSSYGCKVRLWNSTTGVRIAALKGHSDDVMSVAFSPDSTRIVSGSCDLTVQIWNSTTGAHITTLRGHLQAVLSVAFSLDNSRVVSGSEDHTVRLWDLAAGTCIATLKGHVGAIKSAAFSPDGTRIVSMGLVEMRLWDSTTGDCIAIHQGHQKGFEAVTFSPEGTHIVTIGDVIHLWDLVTGKPVVTFGGHSALVNSATLQLHYALNGPWVIRLSGNQFRRVCWLPLAFRGHRLVTASSENHFALAKGTTLIVLDFSNLS